MHPKNVWHRTLLVDDDNPGWHLSLPNNDFFSSPLANSLRQNQKYSQDYQPIPLKISFPGTMADVDVVDTHYFAVSAHARSIIDKLVPKGSLQYISTEVEGGPYEQELYIVNVLNIINGLDWERSKYTFSDENYINLSDNADALILRRKALPEHAIFTLEKFTAYTFFTQSVKDALEKSCSHNIAYERVRLSRGEDDSPAATIPTWKVPKSRLP